MIKMKDCEFNEIVPFIYDTYGINLEKKRGLMEGRLSLRVLERGFDNYSDYFKHVLADKSGKELSNLINVLTTNYTFFMREKQHFDFLDNIALPQFKKDIENKNLRVWSAGCASGEEPYTLAMLLDNYQKFSTNVIQPKILATDISERALSIALEGEYKQDAIKTLPDNWVKKYFDKAENEKFKVKPNIQNSIEFKKFNLMSKVFPFNKKFHMIFCRNVMIYFDAPTKQKLINKFFDATEPGGYLFIGHAESIVRGASGYKYIQPAVFQKPLV